MSSYKQVLSTMQQALDKLGIPLTVIWKPDPKHEKHGEVKASTLLIYNSNQTDAWSTFIHEVFEYKFNHVTSCYRLIINSLIETLEKLVYSRKEEFLESIPKIMETIQETRKQQ